MISHLTVKSEGVSYSEWSQRDSLYYRNTIGVQLNYTLAVWPSGFFFQFYQDIIDIYQYIILGR